MRQAHVDHSGGDALPDSPPGQLVENTGGKVETNRWIFGRLLEAPAGAPASHNFYFLSTCRIPLDRHHVELLVVELRVWLEDHAAVEYFFDLFHDTALLFFQRTRDIRIDTQ